MAYGPPKAVPGVERGWGEVRERMLFAATAAWLGQHMLCNVRCLLWPAAAGGRMRWGVPALR